MYAKKKTSPILSSTAQREKEGIVLPVYGSLMTDNEAVDTFKRVFKGKKIITVNARELLLGGGSIHCATN